MIHLSKLGLEFWAEAVATAVYIRNCSHKAQREDTIRVKEQREAIRRPSSCIRLQSLSTNHQKEEKGS